MAVLVYYLVQNSTSFSILSVKNVKENCIPEPFYIRKMGHSGYFPGSKYRWQCFFVLLLFFPFLINQCGIGGFGPPTSKERVVMLDENGKEMSSEQMADLVADAGITVCTIPNSNQIGRFIILSVHC